MPATIIAVRLPEPANLEVLKSWLLNPAHEMALATGSPESVDGVLPGRKDSVPISGGMLSEPETILINTVRRTDADGSATGPVVDVSSGG